MIRGISRAVIMFAWLCVAVALAVGLPTGQVYAQTVPPATIVNASTATPGPSPTRGPTSTPCVGCPTATAVPSVVSTPVPVPVPGTDGVVHLEFFFPAPVPIAALWLGGLVFFAVIGVTKWVLNLLSGGVLFNG